MSTHGRRRLGRTRGPSGRRFDEFVAARSRALLRTAYLLTHDHALAEDLLQTALAKAWFAWRRIDGNPEPYVRRILVNTYASWWRRKWNGEHPTDELPEHAPPRDAATEPTDLWTRHGAAPAPAARGRGPALLRGPHRGPDRRACSAARSGTVKSQCSKALAKLRIDPALDRGGRRPAMNTLSDLRSTLDEHAERVPDGEAVARTAAVRHRVSVVRRRRRAVGGRRPSLALLVGAASLVTARPQRRPAGRTHGARRQGPRHA